MTFASVAQVKDGVSRYLARAKKTREPIVVTHHGRPYALIQPLGGTDLDELAWRALARRKLTRRGRTNAWPRPPVHADGIAR
jgi:prevent-host-death family protein